VKSSHSECAEHFLQISVLGTTEQVAEKGLISGAPEKQTPGAALPKKLPVSTDFLSKKKSFWARVEFRRPARLLPTW
jgi:hypothetical protein